MVQEREKREHREKQEAGSKGEKERERKSEPGFDGRWYTDTDSHRRHRDRYGWASLLYTPPSFSPHSFMPVILNFVKSWVVDIFVVRLSFDFVGDTWKN